MPTMDESRTSTDNQTPGVSPGNYSPVTVTVNDSIGALFLGTLTVILLIGWMRTEARYRALIMQKEAGNGNHWTESR